MEIDQALARLGAVYERAGLPPVCSSAKSVEQDLEAIAEAIAPLRLPDDAVAFFRRVVLPHGSALLPPPSPTSPAFAFETWLEHQEYPGMVPRMLFPIAYESQALLLVELIDGKGHGGPVFYWAYGGQRFTLRHTSVTAFVDLWATMVELGEFTRRTLPDGRHYYEFDPARRWDDACAVRLRDAGPVPGHDRLAIEEKVGAWPLHWQAAEGLTEEDRRPRGATTTIAQLLASASGDEAVRGTIQGTVIRLAMTGDGCRTVVEDGSAELDLWCPNAVRTYGPTLGRRFEFDVTVRPHPTGPPDTDHLHREAARSTERGDLGRAQDLVRQMVDRMGAVPPSAEATAVRPLE